MKPELTVNLLQQEAFHFAGFESARWDASLYGVTDGKAIGTYFEHRSHMAARTDLQRVEFGDFQTPSVLARSVCQLLRRTGCDPQAILEPNCGAGSFLAAAAEVFPRLRRMVGVEVDPAYAVAARTRLETIAAHVSWQVQEANFFEHPWETVLRSLPQPLLVLGNPPWVTNAALGRIDSSNLPQKSNFYQHSGLDAVTGKSNFDISEWMLLQELHWIAGRQATLAMLCKTSVARKVLLYAWENDLGIGAASLYHIDAEQHFGAMVDACLLVVHGGGETRYECEVYDCLEAARPQSVIGYHHGRLVADMRAYERWRHLEGDERFQWRSGIKHDAAKVMELRGLGSRFRNGFGAIVDLERDYLYPMLKSSDVAGDGARDADRWMLVTQRSVGEDTRDIQLIAPKTWQYLLDHAHLLDRRKSTIYRNRPRFSMFGVGLYSFSLWKVAISGFYKQLDFRVVGPIMEKSVVFDDTCYFLPFETEHQAQFVAELLNSATARDFYSAFVFWDAKRPITVAMLRRLDLYALAVELGRAQDYSQLFGIGHPGESESLQMELPL